MNFFQERGPELACDPEKLGRQLPPLLQVCICHRVEPGEIAFFGFHPLDQIGESPAKPDGIRRIGGSDQRYAAEMILDGLRQSLLPGQNQIGKTQCRRCLRDGRIKRQRFGIGGIKEACVVIGFAQGTDGRQDCRSLADQIGQFGAQHAGGAAGRHKNCGAG